MEEAKEEENEEFKSKIPIIKKNYPLVSINQLRKNVFEITFPNDIVMVICFPWNYYCGVELFSNNNPINGGLKTFNDFDGLEQEIKNVYNHYDPLTESV